MSDQRLRDLERRWRETGTVEDEAAYLLERVRAGDLSRERLEIAAYLGHEGAAMALAPTRIELLWDGQRANLNTLFGRDPTLPLRVGHALVETVCGSESGEQCRLELPAVDELLSARDCRSSAIPRDPSLSERAIELLLLAAAESAHRRWNMGVLVNDLARTVPAAFAKGLSQAALWALEGD
jgi:hypothetical protein